MLGVGKLMIADAIDNDGRAFSPQDAGQPHSLVTQRQLQRILSNFSFASCSISRLRRGKLHLGFKSIGLFMVERHQ